MNSKKTSRASPPPQKGTLFSFGVTKTPTSKAPSSANTPNESTSISKHDEVNNKVDVQGAITQAHDTSSRIGVDAQSEQKEFSSTDNQKEVLMTSKASETKLHSPKQPTSHSGVSGTSQNLSTPTKSLEAEFSIAKSPAAVSSITATPKATLPTTPSTDPKQVSSNSYDASDSEDDGPISLAALRQKRLRQVNQNTEQIKTERDTGKLGSSSKVKAPAKGNGTKGKQTGGKAVRKKYASDNDDDASYDGSDAGSESSGFSDLEPSDEESDVSDNEGVDIAALKKKAAPAKKTPVSRASQPALSTPSPKVGTKRPLSASPASPSPRTVPSPATDNLDEDGKRPILRMGEHSHNFWSFLFPPERKDAAGRKPSHPLFNPKTIYVPPSFLSKLTPATQQWWQFKSKNMDTILFFRIGKFYETFHMDADICVKELGLIYMRGQDAHAGFPELSYAYHSEMLVKQGYRVARVEQTESPEQLKERNDILKESGMKKVSVVRRDFCGIKSKGTRTMSTLIDVVSGASKGTAETAWKTVSDPVDSVERAYSVNVDKYTNPGKREAAELALQTGFHGSYLYALQEYPIPDFAPVLSSANQALNSPIGGEEGQTSQAVDLDTYHNAPLESLPMTQNVLIGLTIVDTMTGEIRLCQFRDDAQRAALRTILSRYPPSEILIQKGIGAQDGTTTAPTDSSKREVDSMEVDSEKGASLTASSAISTKILENAGISAFTRRILLADAPSSVMNVLLPDEEFWTAEKTYKELRMEPYIDVLNELNKKYNREGASKSRQSAFVKKTLRDEILEKKYSIDGEQLVELDIYARDYFNEEFTNLSKHSQTAGASGTSLASAPETETVVLSNGETRHFPKHLVMMLEHAKARNFSLKEDVTYAYRTRNPMIRSVKKQPMKEGAVSSNASNDQSDYILTPTSLDLSTIALSSLGAVIFWLRRCIIDHQVFSVGNIREYLYSTTSDEAHELEESLGQSVTGPSTETKIYKPTSSVGADDAKQVASMGYGEGSRLGQGHLFLDGNTLLNLDMVENSWDGSRKGTLLSLLDNCSTPMGKRLFKQWLTTPLLLPRDINDRLDAVENLFIGMQEFDILRRLQATLKGMPDLERLLMRIHGLGSAVLSVHHPDSRASFYEQALQDQKKVDSFLSALEAFKMASEVRAMFHEKSSNASTDEGKDTTGNRDIAFSVKYGDGALLSCVTSPMLRRIIHEEFPDLAPLLQYFNKAYSTPKGAGKDIQKKITPAPGIDAAYDEALEEIRATKEELEDILTQCRKQLKCPSIEYFHGAKDTQKYQLAIPESYSKQLSSSYVLTSKTKKVWRYHTPEILSAIDRLMDAESRRDACVNDGLRKLFSRFDEYKSFWSSAAKCLAVLDCLMSLAIWSSKGDGGVMSRPIFVSITPSKTSTESGDEGTVSVGSELSPDSTTGIGTDDKAAAGSELRPTATPFLYFRGARNPTICAAISKRGSGAQASIRDEKQEEQTDFIEPQTFIPFDFSLGRYSPVKNDPKQRGTNTPHGFQPPKAQEAPMVLISGANMGGKSTYLRTCCSITILAQLGCYVPAEECILTPVDRIFTRVGANDRILAGQSTFFVELAETAIILRQATRHSLVILDELGRGTSTFDGAAIAYAVTRFISSTVRSRCLFATHYHTLSDDFALDKNVGTGHMACLVETEDSAGNKLDPSDQRVTFLYKFQQGPCPKSYGLNVAKLARLPDVVIKRAMSKSEEFEQAIQEAEKKDNISQSTALLRRILNLCQLDDKSLLANETFDVSVFTDDMLNAIPEEELVTLVQEAMKISTTA